ncbi:BglII/BstYI family type II restriction endonuclease [Taklimakanibacter deserti]|uniref:BglII/BstYI family type II restriction endonuclease n=1 Tax=Taklimakanibacter deserti TaxID=2267839 RepID=UPI000E649AC4
MFEALTKKGFQVEFHSHAQAILSGDFPDASGQLEAVLANVTIPIEEIVGSGGGETKGTQRLRKALAEHGWLKHNFVIEKIVDGEKKESQSHEIDHVKRFDKGIVALEIEWNNKDPFFDRDLENFKRLHAEGAISVGIIVTRGLSLQDNMRPLVRRFAGDRKLGDIDHLRNVGLNPTSRQVAAILGRVKRGAVFGEAWADLFVSDKYGASTTHWRKLEDRVQRGVGNPCPLVLVGLPDSTVTFGEPAEAIKELIAEAEATQQESD